MIWGISIAISIAVSIAGWRIAHRFAVIHGNSRATTVIQGLLGSFLVSTAGFFPVNVTIMHGPGGDAWVWLFPWDVDSAGLWIAFALGLLSLLSWFFYDRAPEPIRATTAIAGIIGFIIALATEHAGLHALSGAFWQQIRVDALFGEHVSASQFHLYSMPISGLLGTFGASWLTFNGWRIAYGAMRQYVMRPAPKESE